MAVILLLDAEPLFWAAAHHVGGVASFDFAPSLVVPIGEALVGFAVCFCTVVILDRKYQRAALHATE
jgi:hypothetical protein